MRTWSRWLPTGTLASAVPTETCEAALRDWSCRWLARDALTLAGGWRPVAGDPSAGAHVIAGELALGFQQNGDMALGEMIYGSPAAGQEVGPEEQRAIEIAVAKAANELRRDLAKANDVVEGWSTGPVDDLEWVFAADLVSKRQRRIGTIFVGRKLLVRRRLAVAPPAKVRIIVTPKVALSAQPLRLGARIGATTLPLRDLSSLCVGDVLLLDQAAAEPLELTVDGRNVGYPCRLANASGELVLQIQ